MENPQLRRDLQLIPATAQGRRMIAFVDPLNLVGGDIACDMELYSILELLDGRHSLSDIQLSLVQNSGGTLISLDRLEAFLDDLDRHFLLESERFRIQRDRLHREFGAEPYRYPAHAGTSYDAEAFTLASGIEAAEAQLPPADEYTNAAVRGILAPHIDIGVAKATYVDLYRHVKGKHYGRVIVFGINHQVQDGLYCLCDKGFITPFGRIEADRHFIAELKRRLPQGTIATDDFGHKMEHSIEFQTLFLHHYLKGPFKIVPVLCGGIHEFLAGPISLLEHAGFRKTVDAMTEMIASDSSPTLVVAAVDFSHVGLKFGHRNAADVLLPKALESDRLILSHIEKGNAEGIFEHARETQDRFNVCGLPSIMLFTRLMCGCKGRCIAHQTYREPATASAVTYASMIFTDSEKK